MGKGKTDRPFGKNNMLEDRYALLRRPGADTDSVTDEDEDGGGGGRGNKSQEYAAFLKEKERRCGPDGFVDSTKYRHSFGVKTDKKSASAGAEGPRPPTVVDIMLKKERDTKEYDKRLKVIEIPALQQRVDTIQKDHMWQHKQEERELKRVEGDIVKNQRTVRKTLRDYENAITRKRLTEEKKLNQGLEKYTKLQRHHTHKKEDLTKQRIEANMSTDQQNKDAGRKIQLTTSDLARQYRTKTSEMEVRRIEVDRLSKEFEAKLRSKEEEQYRLKQELAELSIALNMEAQKGRQVTHDMNKAGTKERHGRVADDRETSAKLDSKLAKSDGDTKAAIMTRRKLSADLALTRAHLSLKQREEGRHKQDTETRLKNNIAEQKALNEAAMQAEMDLKSKQIEQRIHEHDSRKRVAMTTHLRTKKDSSEKQEVQYAAKHAKRHADQLRREHEDHLKHFQKMVTKGEEIEYNLYNKVKNAEYSRQKQEQSVKRLQGKLSEAKRTNAQKIKQEMTELQRQEMALEHKLSREQGQLAKVHAEREETYQVLQKHREQLRTDKYLLAEHEREHNRLIRVGNRTEQVAESYG